MGLFDQLPVVAPVGKTGARFNELNARSKNGSITDLEVDELYDYYVVRQEDFTSYCKYLLPNGAISGNTYIPFQNFHYQIMEKLNKMLLKGYGRFMLSMPPQHFKTLICTNLLVSYVFQIFPGWSTICATYNRERATEVMRDIRDWIMDDKWQEKFGHRANISTVDADATSKTKKTQSDKSTVIYNTKHRRGKVKSIAFNSTATGNPCSLLIIDDPLQGSNEANSKVIRNKLFRTYTTNLATRMQKTSLILMIGTRWHDDDLQGRILKIDKKRKPIDKLWHYWNFPAIKPAGKNDYDTRKTGELLIDLLASKYKEQKEELSSHDWLALYQGVPPNTGGLLFNRSMFKRFIAWPDQSMFERIYISVDTGFNGKSKSSDLTAIQVWGATKNDQFYLLEHHAARMSSAVTIDYINDLCNKYPHYDNVLVENKANGVAVLEKIMEAIPGVIAMEPGSASKWARALLVLKPFERGQIHIAHTDIDPSIEDWLDEVTNFDGEGKIHDDNVDAMVYAMQALIKNSYGFLATVQAQTKLQEIGKTQPRVNDPFTGDKVIHNPLLRTV